MKYVNITNRESNQIRCTQCGHISRGKIGARLHQKYSHKKDINDFSEVSYCCDCNREVEDSRKHMIEFHRR